MSIHGFTDCTQNAAPIPVPLYFVVNPEANNGRAQAVWAVLKKWLDEERKPYHFVLTKDADHVEEMARAAAIVPGAVITAVGGDGTLSRLADALAGTQAILGLIPAGTGNDFARSFQIPADPVEACCILLEGETVPLDVGRLNGKLFLNVVGAGLDAEVVADANRVFKKISGSAGYVLALLRQLLIYRPETVELSVDGETLQAKVWLVAIANACYYGGGMKVAPQADPQDGQFDLIMVADISRLLFLRLFPLVYSGKHIEHPAVRTLRGSEISVKPAKVLHVHADGELYGTTPLNISVWHHAIRLKVPRKG